MIPAPNVVAGILIGAVNTTWTMTLLSSLGWPLIFCVYVSMADSARRDAAVALLAGRGSSSPARTFYLVEAVTALTTVLPVALLAHAARRLFT